MFVSDAPVPFISFGICKTGSTSMGEVLQRHFGPVKSRGQHSHILNRTCRGTATEKSKCGGAWSRHHVLAPAPDTHFKFTFVRNPWDRITSLFEYLDVSVRKDMDTRTFEKFVDNVARKLTTTSPQKGMLLKPQYDWVHCDDGILHADFVGRFERIDEDWAHVCEKLQLYPDGCGLERLKVSKRRCDHWREYYTSQRLIDQVGDLYERDITTWGYTFDE